jgi:putative hydrolase of the HAD superfamily
MKRHRVKAIFFDAADTLFYIEKGLGHTYAGVARKYGADPDPGEIKKAFSRAFKTAPPLAFRDVTVKERQRLEKEWWRAIVEKVYSEIGMFDEFDPHFDELFEVFRGEAWTLFPETADVLSSLKESGYSLGIISNFDSRVYDVMRQLGIYEYFDVLVISSEAGHAKPSHGIFSKALEQAGRDPREVIHVGDDLCNDFHGARAMGIRALLLDREGEYAGATFMDRIEDLTAIERVLGKKA